MKKILKILACTFAFMISFACFSVFTKSESSIAFAESSKNSLISTNVMTELEDFLGNGENKNVNRFPGTAEEFESAMFIKNKLESLSNFKAVNNLTTKDGIQKFDFVSNVDGKKKSSQNIIFRRETTLSKKKVVLATNYDIRNANNSTESSKENEEVVFEGANESASSVALLLSFVKMLDDKPNLDFSVEIVFFGAGTNNFAGSNFFTRCLSDAQCSNILAMINLDKVGLGENNYFYVDEFKNSQSDFVKETLSGIKSVKEIEIKNMLHLSQKSPNGLDYTHIALESDHALLMARHINVVNFFSGSYDKVVTIGTNEYHNEQNITYTKNDNLSFIKENIDNFEQNINDVFASVELLLMSENFVEAMEKDNGSEAFYGIYLNKKLAVFITVILFFCMMVVFNVIFVHLRKKSQKVIDEHGKDKVVVKIVRNIGEGGDDLSNFIDEKVQSDTEKNKDED